MTEFTPTHAVPEGGMRAWDEPDPNRPPVADLGAGTELRVVEERGAWANVLASNGWTGWVDGRRLVVRPAQAVDPSPPEPVAAADDEAPQPEEAPESVQPEPAPDATAVMPAGVPAPSQAVPQPESAPEPHPEPQVLEPQVPVPPGPGFAATHVVPRGGIDAWVTPDPAQAASARLHPGTLLRLDEQLGAWGRVAADNGWSGWVDVRRLVVL